MIPNMPTGTPATTAPAGPPQERPEVDPSIVASVENWWSCTEGLQQRKNALVEYREAHKTLFPDRFNAHDPYRGQTPHEVKTGKDARRVQTNYAFQRTLQTTAMTVPEDFTFEWEPKAQVAPPQDPMNPMPAPSNGDIPVIKFAETLTLVMREMLNEGRFIPKLQAAVQDSDTFPLGILKITFRRDYQTASLNPNPGDKDESDGVARLQALTQRFASGSIQKESAEYQELLSLMTSLRERARVTRWYGLDIQLIPLDSFGMSEEAPDIVDVYETPFMWHDAIKTGGELLAAHPYRTGPDGATYGILESELGKADPYDPLLGVVDDRTKGAASRNRQGGPNTPTNARSSTAGTTDPKKAKYLVREIWSKRDRTVYTIVKGMSHYIDKFVPQKTSERWYPFWVFGPRRCPTEIYAVSTVELVRPIQARIHRKRTDEEKARWLSLPRGIYNRSAGVDEKEMLKLKDVQPGQLRGINFGTTAQKIDDLVQWWKYEYDPESFNTIKDEQDLDQMSALPAQALGQTGSANFATEVSVASAGSTIAANFRKGYFKREIEEGLSALAEILLQEMTPDEVRRLAGPFGVWPEIYDELEAQKIVAEAQDRAFQTAAPTVMQNIATQMLQGVVPTEEQMRAQLEATATPLWQSEMMERFGNIEPMSREVLFQRLKVEIRSSFNSRLDKQQNLQMFAQLGEACMQIGQAAQGLGTPFDMRSVIMHHADLLGGKQIVDKAFPAISPMMIAKQLAVTALQNAQAQAGPAGEGGPPAKGGEAPGAQGEHGGEVDPTQQAQNALASAPAPMG